MHLRLSQKKICLYYVCTVYAVAMTSHENRGFCFQTFLHFFKIYQKIFNSSKLVDFLSEDGPSLAHSKNTNFIGRKCPNFERRWVEYRNIAGEMSIFSQSTPDSPTLFVGGNTLHNCYILHIKFN